MTRSPSFDVPLATRVAYLVDVAARSAYEYQSLQPSIVRLANENNVFVVSRTGGNSTYATPLRVIMDSDAQPIMICK